MSTYLLAFVVCDFESRPGLIVQGSPTKFGIWTRKSKLDETVWAARVGPKVLHFYEDFFGIDFPLPKQDMIGKRLAKYTFILSRAELKETNFLLCLQAFQTFLPEPWRIGA